MDTNCKPLPAPDAGSPMAPSAAGACTGPGQPTVPGRAAATGSGYSPMAAWIRTIRALGARAGGRRRVRALLPVLLLAAALPAGAQVVVASGAADQRVDVLAPRTDVRSVCPDVQADMHKALAQAAWQRRENGVLDVDFQLDGSRIGAVAISGGPFGYRQATRHATRALGCDGGTAGVRTVHMQVVFRDF